MNRRGSTETPIQEEKPSTWPDEGKARDCTFLFITDKPFGIFYETDQELPYQLH